MICITRLYDKALIFLMLSVLIFTNEGFFIPVVVLLTGFSFSLLCQISDNKKIKIIILSAYIILAFIRKEFVIVYPIIFYEIAQTRIKSFIAVTALAGIALCIGKETTEAVVIISAMCIASALQVKSYKYANLSNELIEIRDSGTELKYILETKNRDLIDSQNYEINLATLRERNRIAREIHDNVGHLLTRSILQIGAMLAINKDENERLMLEGIKTTLDNAMTNIRESVHNLHDESIDLINAVNECITPLKSKYEINTSIEIDRNADANVKICIITIIKEAMSNIVKHSNCTKVDISVQEHPAFYKMIIHDNGTDIKSDNSSSGMGITGMIERVERLDGIIRITNEDGFRIFVTIPKKKGEKNEDSNS